MIDTIINNNIYFDYIKFSELCNNCCSEQTFHDLAFTITVAKQLYPDLSDKEAYYKYVNTKPDCKQTVEPIIVRNESNCSSCGGGQIR